MGEGWVRVKSTPPPYPFLQRLRVQYPQREHRKALHRSW